MDKKLSSIFSKIYLNKLWGDDSDEKFYSGCGSHYDKHVSEFTIPVIKFLETFSSPPSILDIGCGDFNVGSKIRYKCGKYIAADIVPELITFNTIKYKDIDVQFLNLDITTDDLPNAEIIIVRQVFQHLSNECIKKALDNISKSNFKYLISSEHYFFDNPRNQVNVTDLESGESIIGERGIDFSMSPFNLSFIEKNILHDKSDLKGFVFKLKP
jgi:SAM-dependent methyltransferase